MKNLWKNYKYIIIAVTFFLVVAGCIFLPPYISSFGDVGVVGTVHIVEAEGPITLNQASLPTVEKLMLLENNRMANSLSIGRGKYIEEDRVLNTASIEIEKLKGMGIFPSYHMSALGYSANFYIQTDEPTKNLIVWSVHYDSDQASAIVYLDDETGKILKCILFTEDLLNYNMQMDYVAQQWAAYLGIEYVESKTELVQYTINDNLYLGQYTVVQYMQDSISMSLPIQTTPYQYSFGSIDKVMSGLLTGL